MARFVLIHGAWHGGWCWERVAPLLEAAGHSVEAPDLPGMGADTTPLTGVTLESWAHFVAERAAAGAPAILVGHSRGGVVISQAAEFAPDAIARLVYLTAFVPRDGQSLLELAQASPVASELTPDKVVFAEDGVSCTVPPAAVAPTFYNTTAPAWSARAAGLLTPEPVAVLQAPLRLSEAAFGRVPKSYVECRDDRAIDLSLQRLMQSHWRFDEVVSLSGDHSPFYSAPERLAETLCALA